MDIPLAKIDLNLLVALRTLMEERSVTRAAERLFITQPAMSKTLQRLRELFQDELFTRSSRGLVPTPRALELEKGVQQALEYMESTIFSAEFDPATAEGEIHICAPEMFIISAIPKLTAQLADQAPGVLLQSRNLLDGYVDLLAHGSLDFSIYVNQHLGEEYATYPILAGIPSVWLPADHPLAEKHELQISDLVGMPSVSVFLPGFSQAELNTLAALFAEHGVNLQQPLIQTTQLLIAMEVITRRNAFMLGPDMLDDSQLANNNVISRPLAEMSIREAVQLDIVLVQHQRTMNSPLHSWIRGLILDSYARYQDGLSQS